jgi:hypothetical protein
LFNLSLLSGVFLCVWKESYVLPLLKTGDKRNISNYRGISILLAIPKLFEKLVCDVITLIICRSISDEQHSFVGGRSTVTILVKFSNFVLIEMKDRVDAVYSNISKALDRVNHGLLLGTDSKDPWSDDFSDGFLFDRSYTTRLGWRLFV